VALHAVILAALLIRKYNTTVTPKRGIIAVEFIHSVKHEEPAVEQASGRKRPTFRAKQPAPPPQAEAVAAADATAAPELSAYIEAVLKMIHRRKIYPPEAIDRGEEGRVLIGVSVARSGEVLETRIEEPSPFSRLNQAALQTVSGVKAFPPLPSGLAEPFHMHIPLVYRVESH